jgi:hypothetical protein
MHSTVKILTVRLAVNLASGVQWVEKTVRCLRPVAQVFQLKNKFGLGVVVMWACEITQFL